MSDVVVYRERKTYNQRAQIESLTSDLYEMVSANFYPAGMAGMRALMGGML